MENATFLIELSARVARGTPLRQDLRWETVQSNDGSGRVIVPSMPPAVLYRGQNARHSPCLPSICRGFQPMARVVSELRRRDQLLLIKRLAQGRWFAETLSVHPAVRWATEQKLELDRVALALHYGDLTESFDVAAFFATCYFDEPSKKWLPCDDGEGVVYRLDWTLLPPSPKRVRWIGLQPLPRPSEQWGWTCELFLGEDFEQAPSIENLPFKHSRVAGEHFLQEFSSGDALFPSDPMARVAERIVLARTLPRWALTETIADLMSDPKGIRRATEDEVLEEIRSELGLVGDSEAPSPMEGVDSRELEAIWASRSGDFLRGVGFRLARTRRDGQSSA